MERIVMTRIDDRLIHGQVMTSWLNFTGANKIMIIDDDVAVDPFIKSVLKTCVPANIKLATFGIEKAFARLQKGFTEPDKVIILAKYPKTLHTLMKMGIKFDKINIGGMGVSGDRKKFYKNISASDEEKQMLKELIESGAKVEVQIIAEDQATDVSKLV